MQPYLIGLKGYARQGKSTAAAILAELHGYQRDRFAAPLKDMLYALGLTVGEVDGSLKEEPCKLLGGKTPRHAMVTLGTEWGRNTIDVDLWVRLAMQRVSAWQFRNPSSPYYVFDDVRLPNEAVAIRERGGTIWEIHRGGCAGSDHISEAGQDAIIPDYFLCNHGDVDDLRESIRTTLQQYQ